jgi:signal transduction histidine kinase
MHLPHPIRWLRSHPRGADALLMLLVSAAAVPAHLWNEPPSGGFTPVDPAWWTVALVLLGTVPLYWRRTHTLVAAMIVVTAEVAALFIDISGSSFLGSIVAVYSVGAHTVGVGRTRIVTLIAVLVLGLFVAGQVDGLSLLPEFISTGVVLVTAFVLGDNLRRRRQHVTDLAERAARAEREQGLVAEQRVAAERTRIARDLHDVVAHSVSVMVIQAAAARRSLDTDPGAAAEALRSIEATGRTTMNELRTILGVLRTEDGATERQPQPSLSHLDDIVHDGLEVDVTVEGDPARVPVGASTTGYRLVQEALTNVLRHGGPSATAQVRVVVTDHRLEVEVVDDGRGAGALDSGEGFGIIGMSERVAALGGILEAGPRRGGGWRVHAEIPLLFEGLDRGASRLAAT